MQRQHFALHARCDHSGLAFDLDGFILPDDEVADLEAEGFFSPGVHASPQPTGCCVLLPVHTPANEQISNGLPPLYKVWERRLLVNRLMK